MKLENSKEKQEEKNNELIKHKIIVFSLYAISLVISYKILYWASIEKNSTLVLLISTGAIIATFGSALSSIGGIWERDLLERVLENTDILFTDILKQERWRRWPFLSRTRVSKQLDGSKIVANLSNATVPINVGTHHIKVDVPTVLDDFFDLPLRKNAYTLYRYRAAASTTLLKGKDEQASVVTATGLNPSDELMAYENLYSSWAAILKFRLFRYISHLGSSLTVFGTVLTIFYCIKIYA